MLDGQLVLDNNAQLESSNSKYTNLIAYFWSPFTYNGPNTQITGTIQLYKPFNTTVYNNSNNKNNHIYDALNCDYLVYTADINGTIISTDALPCLDSISNMT